MVKRKIFNKILANLEKDDILLIIGARQVGKTTVLRALYKHLEKSGHNVHMFSLEDPMMLADLNKHPENIFNYVHKKEGRSFLLLDEVQYLDNPTNFLKYIYDKYRQGIKIIVSGSSAFYVDAKFKDSLAGRKKIIELFPFSFSEFLLAVKEEELSAVISGHDYFQDQKKLELLKPELTKLLRLWREYSIYGGYPKVVLEEDETEKKYYLKELYQSFLKKDVHESGIGNEAKFFMLVKLLAAQAGQLVNAHELSDTLDISNDTVHKYLHVLSKSYIIKLYRPFFRNIRKELTKMPKVCFFDIGYRNSILNTFDDLMSRVDGGATLENIFFTELIKSGISEINYWRTQSRHEIDFIVDEKYAFEIKVNKKSFKTNKYSQFVESYPDIRLIPVSCRDDKDPDILDFAS